MSSFTDFCDLPRINAARSSFPSFFCSCAKAYSFLSSLIFFSIIASATSRFEDFCLDFCLEGPACSFVVSESAAPWRFLLIGCFEPLYNGLKTAFFTYLYAL